jgi:hypothetical protein
MQKMENLKKLIRESEQQASKIPSPPVEPPQRSIQNDTYEQFRKQLEMMSPSLNNGVKPTSTTPNTSSFKLNSPGLSKEPHSRTNTASNPVYFEKITCPELQDRLFKTAPKLLILDIRPVEEYIQGHIGWKSGLYQPGVICGGVVNIEPEWLKPKVTAAELEDCLSSFGASNSQQKSLFQARNQMEMIVFCDSSTRSIGDSKDFEYLSHAIFGNQITDAPKCVPKYLSGGYVAWNYYIRSTPNLDLNAWIQIGEGIGIQGFGDHVKKSIPDAANNIASARLNHFGNMVNSPVHSRTNSAPKQTTSPEREASSPTSKKQNFVESKSGVRIPVRQSSMKNLKERQDTSFDDPFFTFSRSSVHLSPSRTDVSTAANVSNPVGVPKDAPKPQGLVKPLIDLPKPGSTSLLEDVTKRFPEIQLSDPQVVKYPTAHSRSNSPAPFSSTLGYDKTDKEQVDFHSKYPTVETFDKKNPIRPPTEPALGNPGYGMGPNYTPNYVLRPPSATVGNYSSYRPNTTAPPNYTAPTSSRPNIPIQPPLQQPVSVSPRPIVSAQQYISNTSNLRPANPSGQPPPLLPKPVQLSTSIQNTTSPQPPALPPKPSATSPTLNSNLDQKTPPPLLPKPQQLAPVPPPKLQNNAPSLPPKPRIDVSQPVLIRGQNPMLLPTSPIHSSFGVSGLRNLGNTCFMNSTIQCLSATIPLARYFLGGTYRKHIATNNPLSSKGRVATSYARLIQSMWSRDESVVVPSEFKSVVGDLHPSFAGNEQQDSQEFLSFLLDQLHEDLNIARRPFPPPPPDYDSENYPERQLMEMEWKNYRARNWSIIVDMFQGTLKSKLQCLTCGKVIFVH